MAYPDLSDLRTRVRAVVNEDSASTFLPNAVLNRFLNDGERDVACKTGCIENIDSLTTTAFSRLVQFSGHKIKDLEYIAASARVGLQKITLKHFGHVQLDGAAPQYWTQWGNTALIEPLPGSTAYTLHAYVSDYPPTEMSEDTDEPAVPASFYEDVVQFAVIRSLLRDRKFQHAAFAYNKYIESIQIKRRAIIAQQNDTKMGIKIPDVLAKEEKE